MKISAKTAEATKRELLRDFDFGKMRKAIVLFDIPGWTYLDKKALRMQAEKHLDDVLFKGCDSSESGGLVCRKEMADGLVQVSLYFEAVSVSDFVHPVTTK